MPFCERSKGVGGLFNDLTLGQYYPAPSPLHRLDARTKLVGTIVFMVGLFTVKNTAGYIFVTLFTLALLVLSRVPFRLVLKSLRPLKFILIFTLIINLFMTSGEVVLTTLGPLRITEEGLARAVMMTLRIAFLVMGTSLLTLTTTPINLTDGMERLMAPGRRWGIPAHELAMMMGIALRFIPTLAEETQRIMYAQMARGADFESGGLLHRARAMVPLLVPLFVSAFRRAEELATAMEARCYRGGDQRTRMREMAYTRLDVAGGAIMVFYLLISIGSRWMG